MEKLSTGLDWLLPLSALAATLAPLLATDRKTGLRFSPASGAVAFLKAFGAGFVLLAGLGVFLHLAVAGMPLVLFAVAALLVFVAGSLGLSPLARGGLILLISWLVLPVALSEPANQMQWLAWLAGLVAFRLGSSLFIGDTDWDDLLPAVIYVIGSYWGQIVPLPTAQQALLPVVLSVALLLRALQAFQLPLACGWARGGLMALLGALAAWLALQNLVPELPARDWIVLFAGAIVLATVLHQISEADAVTLPKEPLLHPAPHALMALALIGLATLAASRLFGAVGWVVLAAGMLAMPQARPTVFIAAFFWAGRVLLQGFLFQYNPNVTGINITHPYAGAALYAGLVLMLLLPLWLHQLAVGTDQEPAPRCPVPVALIVLSGLLLAGLANFFLHAEATGSLLTALTVGGVAVALLGNLRVALGVVPLWLVAACLLLNDLLTQGNEADKGLKVTVLVAAGLVTALLLWLGERTRSRKPVEVS